MSELEEITFTIFSPYTVDCQSNVSEPAVLTFFNVRSWINMTGLENLSKVIFTLFFFPGLKAVCPESLVCLVTCGSCFQVRKKSRQLISGSHENDGFASTELDTLSNVIGSICHVISCFKFGDAEEKIVYGQ